MTPPPSPSEPLPIRRRLVRSGLERTVRYLPRPATGLAADGDVGRGRRDLEIVVAVVVGMATVVSGPLVWAVAVLLLAATVVGTLQVLAEVDSPHAERGVPVESLTPFRDMLIGGIVKALDEQARDGWARNQTYIALGNLLTSAALLGIDACPMEGFDRAQYDEILGLKDEGYASAVIATLGYRASTDKYADAAKVRFSKEQIFTHI